MQNLLSTAQAAEMLNVSVESIRSMISKGEIKSHQTEPGRPHLIPLGEIIRNQPIKPRSVKMTFWQYTQINGLNASKIKLLNQSLNHFLLADRDDAGKSSLALSKGLAIHSWLECKLSGEPFENHVVAEPVVDKRTKAGKEVIQSFQAEHKDQILLSQADFTDVVEMGESILSTPEVWQFIRDAEVEEVITWMNDGIKAKARLDYCLTRRPVVVDLKSCQDASPYGFSKAVRRYGYDVQANWYRRAYQAAYNVWPEFLFLAVESKPPYNVGLYKLSDQILALADLKVDSAVDLFRQYINGEVARQGYQSGIYEIS